MKRMVIMFMDWQRELCDVPESLVLHVIATILLR